MTSDVWVPGEVDTITMYDAAFLPLPVPTGADAWMVYAGGSSATRRDGWRPGELTAVEHLPRLPVWVPTPGLDNPRQAGLAFVAWLTQHNVPATNKAGEHTLVMWDLETGREPYPRWVNTACDVLKAHGYYNLIYGSISTLFGQPARSGYFVADPTGQPHLYAHEQVVGTQYQWGVKVPGGVVDKSLFVRSLADQLWQPAP